MKQVQLFQVTPEQLQADILQGVKKQLDELKKSFQPKQPVELMTRKETAALLKCNMSTLHNLKKRGDLVPVGLGGRVYYRRSDIENRLVELS